MYEGAFANVNLEMLSQQLDPNSTSAKRDAFNKLVKVKYQFPAQMIQTNQEWLLEIQKPLNVTVQDIRRDLSVFKNGFPKEKIPHSTDQEEQLKRFRKDLIEGFILGDVNKLALKGIDEEDLSPEFRAKLKKEMAKYEGLAPAEYAKDEKKFKMMGKGMKDLTRDQRDIVNTLVSKSKQTKKEASQAAANASTEKKQEE